MKKTNFALLLFMGICVCTATVQAQNPDRIIYEDVRIENIDDQIEISFNVITDHSCVNQNSRLILTPILSNGVHKGTLPKIVIQSRLSEWKEYRAGEQIGTANIPVLYRIRPGDSMEYKTRIPYNNLLLGASLKIERTEQRSSGKVKKLSTVVFTDKPVASPSLSFVPVYGFPIAHQSIADSLSAHYPFIAPISEFEKNRKSPSQGEALFNPAMPLNMGKGLSLPQQDAVEQFIANNEKGAIQINFSRAGTEIDRYYKENNSSLVTLASVLKKIQASGDSKVEKIVIAGFASPDGPLVNNDRFAWQRANAVRDFIRANSTVSSDKILLYNGSEDWNGLRKLVEESDIESKYEILYIIDRVPILSGREKMLMDLAGGRPYRFMARYFFPQLRNAAYIKIYCSSTQSVEKMENLQRVVAFIDEGDFQSALDLLASEHDTGDGTVDNLSGVCYLMKDETEKAIKSFRRAVEKGNTYAKQNMEQLYYNTKK